MQGSVGPFILQRKDKNRSACKTYTKHQNGIQYIVQRTYAIGNEPMLPQPPSIEMKEAERISFLVGPKSLPVRTSKVQQDQKEPKERNDL